MSRNGKSRNIFIKIACIAGVVLLAAFLSGCSFFDGTEDKVTLDRTEATVAVGRSVTLIAASSEGRAISWSSDDEDVATVSGGVVTGVSEGTALITASDGKKFAVCEVKVLPLPTEGKDLYTDLVWHDEFDGDALDMTKWSYQTGTKDTEYGGGPEGWGNNEMQYYTDSNATVSDGNLTVTAKREEMGGKHFTSSRITTRDKFTVTYGYIEARMKLPTGKGMWPAFWMVPQPTSQGSSGNVNGTWASNGELDIMEAQGLKPDSVCGTVHYGGRFPNNKYTTKNYKFESSTVASWHTYAVEWTEDYIKWYVDDECFSTVTNDVYYSEASDNPSAPFDQPFYILLNLAVDSGKFDPDSSGGPTSDFTSAAMQVDYVRVWK